MYLNLYSIVLAGLKREENNFLGKEEEINLQ
jgi:hypothetical protein